MLNIDDLNDQGPNFIPWNLKPNVSLNVEKLSFQVS